MESVTNLHIGKILTPQRIYTALMEGREANTTVAINVRRDKNVFNVTLSATSTQSDESEKQPFVAAKFQTVVDLARIYASFNKQPQCAMYSDGTKKDTPIGLVDVSLSGNSFSATDVSASQVMKLQKAIQQSRKAN